MPDEYTRATLIGCLVKTAAGDRALELLDLARSIRGPTERIEALTHILPKLGEPSKRQVLREALAIVDEVQESDEKIYPILGLIPFFSIDEQRAQAAHVIHL